MIFLPRQFAIALLTIGITCLPGVLEANAVNDTPGYFADWFPTLCDAAGFTKPEGLDGESLWPVLSGKRKTLEGRKPLIWVFPEYGGQVALRIGDLKVLRQGLKTKKRVDWEVYDLSQDRSEQHNLAAQHADIIAQAENILRQEVNENNVFHLSIPGVNTTTR